MIEEGGRETIQQLLSGNEDAFREIMEEYARPLFKYSRRMTNNISDAEDITQETFIR